MYNKSRLIGPDFINATTLNICLWTFDAVCILNVYEAALTCMIIVNINDTVQRSDITVDHNP